MSNPERIASVGRPSLPSPASPAAWDGGLALGTIQGRITPGNVLLSVIAERIRAAAAHLRLSAEDLFRVFGPHSIFEGRTVPVPSGPPDGFLIVETHHLIQGMVGKGALKIVFPDDLLGMGACFRAIGAGAVEVLPSPPIEAWADPVAAEEQVRQAMRELMTGESLSMSLKCQATGAPFAGSEGLVLCARSVFEPGTGRYRLEPLLGGTEADAAADKELIEAMMNATAETLTRANRIAYDRIVHAAETNSTLTARLGLELPANVVEGHLRTLLESDSTIVIGDDDMTARLRELLAEPDYRPTRCALARAAGHMQMEHAILLPGSREKLREALSSLPARGSPTPAQYRNLVDLFYGTGEVQQNEDTLFHHRELILRALSVALSAHGLDDCGDPEVLALYLKTLLDNQRIMVETLLLRRLPEAESLPVDWFERARPFTRAQEQQLAALMPGPALLPDHVPDRFLSIVNVLFEARAAVPEDPGDPYHRSRLEFLDLAIRAVTSNGDVLPSVERIAFFTLPFTYECATPKLGVVTRKPRDLCGSELRPEAMAVGAVMSIEILLKRQTRKARPLEGLTVAIEGLGNAGTHVARILGQRGARIVGVSDSRGALVCPPGFTPADLARVIEHKQRGRRLDTFPPALPEASSPATPPQFHPDPEALKRVPADLLVLAAIPASVHEGNARDLPVKVVCELTGAAVSGPGKRILDERQVPVIPDNLASSGGLLVSLSEMLQNSAAQVWDRELEEDNLRDQLARSFDAAFKLARKYDVDLATATDILALQRMQALAVYRAQLELLAAQFLRRLEAVRADEWVLVMSDDDEDGVAAAAILRELVARTVPEAAGRLRFCQESFRSETVLALLERQAELGQPIRHVMVLDRSYPTARRGQEVLARLAASCRVTFVNHHDLPPQMLGPQPGGRPGTTRLDLRRPSNRNILLISPQTLRSTVPSRLFPTAMILKEIAHQLLSDPAALARIDWQAAVGSCLEVPPETTHEWLLFYTQFNPDRTLEAARALRTVTRAGGFHRALHALAAVARTDQLPTHDAWRALVAEHRILDERVQVLVEKIVLENRRKPYTAHFFTPDEAASPNPTVDDATRELDLYHWTSEHLIRRGNLAEKPILLGQVVRDVRGIESLAVRIRSPRGVDLMDVDLPPEFETGGLPNTAMGRFPLDPAVTPQQQFAALVDRIWLKTTSPLQLSPPPALFPLSTSR